MIHNKFRYLLTLVALFAISTGAWADGKVYTSAVDITALQVGDILTEGASINGSGSIIFDINRVKVNGTLQTEGFIYLYTSDFDSFGAEGVISLSNISTTTISPVDKDNNDGNAWEVTNVENNNYIHIQGITYAPAVIEVTWNAASKTGTFSMPGSDVVLTPQYAPAAQLAENGAPAAVSGLEIAADAAIITAGQSAQGTLLYAVGTSETEKPALTAFAATLPNAKDQTAAGNYYVWYYIQGQDTPQGQEPSAENTFNDSEIMGPVMVELLTNEHTLNIKQSPNITVTVAGTAVTPTDDKVTPVTTGQEVKIKAKDGYKFRKVEVKKKEAAKPVTLATALEDGATIKVIFKWRNKVNGDYVQGVYNAASGTFTVSKGGSKWGTDARAVCKVEKSGDNIIIGAGFSGYDIEGMVWTFNTTNDTYTTTNGADVKQFPTEYGLISVSVNDTDITSTLSELK